MTDGKNLFRHLDLKHLRQLMEVADKGSIRAAADALAITQPALSRSIRSIEDILGVKLVERGPRGTELTGVGQTLLKYAQIIDANLSLAEKELGAQRSQIVERIHIGMSWLAEAIIAIPLIDSVLRERPNVRLTTSIGDYEALAPALMSGKLEFFVGPPPRENPTVGIWTQPLAEFPAAVLVRAEHPLTRMEHITYRELAHEQWVLPAVGTLPRIIYDNFFLRHGAAPPEPVLEVQPLSPIIRHLILDQDLVTFLPLVVAESDIARGALKVLPFDDEIVFRMNVTRRQMGYRSPACEYVLNEIKRLCSAYADDASVGDQPFTSGARTGRQG